LLEKTRLFLFTIFVTVAIVFILYLAGIRFLRPSYVSALLIVAIAIILYTLLLKIRERRKRKN
jgi:hypothetical protein